MLQMVSQLLPEIPLFLMTADRMFAWFRRKQELHFVHHRHAGSNFAVIHFFWDRILGTYRRPDSKRMEHHSKPGALLESRAL